MSQFWMSFCDPELPTGEQFLGVCLVEGRDIQDAIDTAYRHGCNPGGEIMFFIVPPELRYPDGYTNRLMSKADVEAMEEATRVPRQTH